MIKAIIKPFFTDAREWPVVRITKNYIVVRWNNIATGKFNRKTGYNTNVYRSRGFTPSTVLNLEELNKLADENGGTIEFEKKAKKK